MQFVRQSKFRHVYCKPFKREFCIEDVRITKISWDSTFCVVNPKFIAIITEGSGGPFTVIPLTKVGRIDKDYPIVDAHRAPCLEICWCPFNDNVIASCSEDCTAKIWHIPDKGLLKTLKEPVVELLGHQKRVSSIVWHPTANNVLLTAGADLKIFLWNVGTGEALIEIDGHPDLIWSVDFNYNGSKIVTTCKDKQIRVIDPRNGRILQHGVGHEGVKPQRAIFMKDGRIFSTGFTKRSERVYALREEQNLEVPVAIEELDTSNGVLFPFYDYDSGLVFLCGKGDSNVRYYEVNDDPPFVHFINVYSTSEPQRGIGFMPKRGLNVLENEISRIYKCTNKGLIDVLQFFVPRKSELFQDDLYPDTAGTVPALTADEWIAGKDASPILMSMKRDKSAGDKPKAAVVKKSNILAESASANQQPPASQSSSSHLRKTPPRSDGEGQESRLSPASPGRSKTSAETKKPRIDDDMGIVDFRQMQTARENAAPAIERTERTPTRQQQQQPPQQQYTGRSTGQEARQQPSSTTGAPSGGRRSLVEPSVGDWGGPLSRSSSCDPQQVEDLIKEIQKLKAVIRGHDRRIRCLEDRLNEREANLCD